MKKITLLLSSIFTLSTLFISSASARGSGYFVDLSLNRVSLTNKVNVSATITDGSNDTTISQPNFNIKNNNLGSASLKLGYKYSNIANSKLFISNSIYYDYINNKSASADNMKFYINNRMGIDVSLGYDITSKLSSYVSVGFADVGYSVDANSLSNSFSTQNGNNICCSALGYEKYSNRSSSQTSGFGARYDLSDDIGLLLEYSRQKITLSSEHPSLLGGVMNTNSRSKIEVIRFGISKAI